MSEQTNLNIQDETNPTSKNSSDKTLVWQKKLLPFMIKTIVTLSFFFFIASLIQLIYLHYTISNTQKFDFQESLSNLSTDSTSDHQKILEKTRLKSMVMLEATSIDNQYHHANVLLMSRLWTSYIGFVTGMILALVGATFILGKLREPISELSAKVHEADISFKSTSPGLILAVLGTALMLTTVLAHHPIDVNQRALYFHDSQINSSDDYQEPPLLPPPLHKPNENDSSKTRQ